MSSTVELFMLVRIGGKMKTSGVFISFLVVAVCTAAGLANTGAAHAREVGLVDASPRAVAKMVKDIGWDNPPKCQDAQRAKSDPSWAVFTLTLNLPPECGAYDGFNVIRKVNGKWQMTGIAASSISCDAFRKELKQEGAPYSVYRDMSSVGYCDPRL